MFEGKMRTVNSVQDLPPSAVDTTTDSSSVPDPSFTKVQVLASQHEMSFG